MEEDSIIGTCLMLDGRYETFSWEQLHKAFKRVLEENYVIDSLSEKQWPDLYNAAMADVLTLGKNIELSQCAY
jgi:hypothetical protein